ncbi:MAG: flavodoxin domain-containing protein [Pseudomonadota bacterium]
MRVQFLYGTETGTAEMLCEDMEAAVNGDHETTVTDMDDADPTALDKDAFHVLVCSTFGTGELPSTAEAFFDKLQGAKPDLSGLSFAIFGLGDRTFGETFNQGSEQLMNEMIARQAVMVGERGIYDASGSDMPEDVAVPWLEDVLAKAAS